MIILKKRNEEVKIVLLTRLPGYQVCGGVSERYRLNVFLTSLFKVQCPNLLNFQNAWGKEMERSGFRFENFYLQRV